LWSILLKKQTKRNGIYFFSAGCLYVLITDLISIADDISDKILSGDMPLDISRLMAEISLQLNGSASGSLNMASLLLLGCWAIAIIDSIIVGRKLTVPTTVNDKVGK
jgi:hypothetical protein